VVSIWNIPHSALTYTTHLPYLIDLRAAGPNEKLTLQAAMSMRLNQHYLVAQRNLVVEGVDDSWIITELAELFNRSDRESLPDDLAISTAGGASISTV